MAQKILIADDDPFIVHLVTARLKQEGFEIISAANGEEALLKFEEHIPALVLIDIMMPKKSGLEVTEYIRNQSLFPDTPILIFSAASQEDYVLKSFRAGADDYVQKPFNPDELIARIHNIMHRIERFADRNPLTQLPGNNIIHKRLQELLNQQKPFSLGYVDLNNFKAFNDFYGFEAGDKVIKFVSETIRNVKRELRPDDYFIGHIGGDDFVYISQIEDTERIADFIVQHFDDALSAFYPPNDFARGYIHVESRQGRMQRFPLMGIAVGIVNVDPPEIAFTSVVELARVAAEVKHKAKIPQKSSYYVNRRTSNGC